jgi:hypothetical protein
MTDLIYAIKVCIHVTHMIVLYDLYYVRGDLRDLFSMIWSMSSV